MTSDLPTPPRLSDDELDRLVFRFVFRWRTEPGRGAPCTEWVLSLAVEAKRSRARITELEAEVRSLLIEMKDGRRDD